MFENGLGKKRFLVISLLFAAVLLLLFHQLFQVDAVAQPTGFIFIFIATIAFFPIPIRREQPAAKPIISSRHNRAPPIN
jgi:hypothetical protein